MMARRPVRIVCNAAMSADGKVGAARGPGGRLASAEDRRRMDLLRAESCAVLIGAGTLRADNPHLQPRHRDALALRRALGRPLPPWQVVIAGHRPLPRQARFFAPGIWPPPLVVVSRRHHQHVVPALPAGCRVWTVGEEHVVAPALVRRLAEHGLSRLLVEGGGDTTWPFAAAGLLDEIHVTVAPSLVGGHGAPGWLGGPGFRLPDRQHLRLVGVEVVGEEIFCRWRVRQATAAAEPAA